MLCGSRDMIVEKLGYDDAVQLYEMLKVRLAKFDPADLKPKPKGARR